MHHLLLNHGENTGLNPWETNHRDGHKFEDLIIEHHKTQSYIIIK